MKKLALSLAVLLFISACQAGNNQADQEAKTAQAPQTNQTQTDTQTQDNKVKGVWIDVRSADEYNAGHLSGAVNIVHTDIANRIAAIAPNKDEPIHLYCRSGRRAEAALQELTKLGYTNVTNHGAYEDLVKQGLK